MELNPPPLTDLKINILMVDDRPENLYALTAVLNDPSYNLVTANSSQEALGKLLKYEFALILLDVFMPGMDGYEVATIIKQRPKTKYTPIIFLTAMAKDVLNIYKAYDIGAVDYIQKPLEASVVKAKVAVFADLYRKTQQIKLQAEQLRESELRQKELELQAVKRAGEKKFQDLVEGIHHGIVWSANPDTLIFSYVSPRAEPILGFPLVRWLSEKGFFESLLFADERDFVLKCFQKAKNGQELDFEHRFMTAKGESLWFHTGVRLAVREEGEGYEIRGLSVDITALKRTEEALRSAVKMRDEFLSMASHELKTPITPIKLQIQTLARALLKSELPLKDPASLSKTVDILNRQIDRLSVLIDGLLDVSRLSSGGLTLELENFDLYGMVQEVMERHCGKVARSDCKVRFLADRPICGFWDRARLEQAFTNLITNAFKYGDGKPVEIEVSSDDQKVKIAIKDQGIGIKKEDQLRIFHRFERAVSSNLGGLGLGLYIAQQIIQVHGGSIYVESELGTGSTFTVELPFRNPKMKLEVKPEPAA